MGGLPTWSYRKCAIFGFLGKPRAHHRVPTPCATQFLQHILGKNKPARALWMPAKHNEPVVDAVAFLGEYADDAKTQPVFYGLQTTINKSGHGMNVKRLAGLLLALGFTETGGGVGAMSTGGVSKRFHMVMVTHDQLAETAYGLYADQTPDPRLNKATLGIAIPGPVPIGQALVDESVEHWMAVLPAKSLHRAFVYERPFNEEKAVAKKAGDGSALADAITRTVE